MKIIIKEDKLKNSLERLIQSTLNSLLEDENTFDSYELDTLKSIDRVEISHITTGIGITVWLNIYSKINENFDFLTSELQYKLKNLIPNIKIFTNDVITPDDEDFINEMIKLDIKVGDTLMGGKFKNKKVVVKTIGKNDKGDITINGKPLLRFRILKEDTSKSDKNKKLSTLDKLLHIQFKGIDDMWVDWSNYNCGMGECCDPYSISFILPEKNYFEYIFKIVDSSKYDDDADYPREMMDELPEPCEQYPDIRESRFDTLYMPEETTESIEQFYGHRMRWEKDMLTWFNDKFGLNLRDIYYQ